MEHLAAKKFPPNLVEEILRRLHESRRSLLNLEPGHEDDLGLQVVFVHRLQIAFAAAAPVDDIPCAGVPKV